MKRIFMLTLVVISFGIARAQHVIYDENVQIRQVGKFTSIDVSGTVSLYLTQGKETGVAVSAGEEKYNEKIKTEVKNDVLRISVDAGVWNNFSWSNRKLKAYVSVSDISSLTVSGACNVNISDNLMVNALKLDIGGASELKGNLKVKNLNINIGGASVVRLSGTAENLYIDASGACKVNAFELKTDNAKVDASGASNVTLTTYKDFSATASGGSTIQYKGEASTRNLNSSTGASIKKRSD